MPDTTPVAAFDARVFHAIAATRQRFIDASIMLRRRPEVLAARSALDCRAYDEGTTLEFYLEVDVAGRTVCWWLEAAWRGSHWEISANVAENQDDVEHQVQLHHFPAHSARTVTSLVEDLDAAAVELLASAESGKFLALAG